MFEKVDTTSVKDRALCVLEEELLSGRFMPGDRLPPEREIAEEMGVSRSIISMCMIELEAKGFVKSVPRQGTFVMDYMKNGTPAILSTLMNYQAEKMEQGLFDSMMATRFHIECECVRLAASNATEEDKDNLSELLEQMELFKETDKFMQLDFEFHHTLAGASGNAVYAMIVRSFEGVISFFQRLAYVSIQTREESIALHRQMLKRICDGDKDGAERLMRIILDNGVRTLEKIYKTE